MKEEENKNVTKIIISKSKKSRTLKTEKGQLKKESALMQEVVYITKLKNGKKVSETRHEKVGKEK